MKKPLYLSTSLALLAPALLLAACMPGNVHNLRNNPAGTLQAHSPDSVRVTADRLVRGMRKCITTIPVINDVLLDDSPTDVRYEMAGIYGGVPANAHLEPAGTGTDVTITYMNNPWRARALEMQTLAKGGETGC